jgi:hypothetical protein
VNDDYSRKGDFREDRHARARAIHQGTNMSDYHFPSRFLVVEKKAPQLSRSVAGYCHVDAPAFLSLFSTFPVLSRRQFERLVRPQRPLVGRCHHHFRDAGRGKTSKKAVRRGSGKRYDFDQLSFLPTPQRPKQVNPLLSNSTKVFHDVQAHRRLRCSTESRSRLS